MDTKTKILVISTGGTISQQKDDYGTAEISEEKSAKFFVEYLERLTSTPSWKTTETLAPVLKFQSKEILNKDSSNVIPEDWKLMVETIYNEYDNFDAFLITHGTNTLGYTCAALSFALGKLGKRVILTGSQVSFGYPGSDAVMNLENAIRVAATVDRKFWGVMAVFGSHIITGVRVKKTTEFEYDAFKTFSAKSSLGRIGRTVTWDESALANHLNFLREYARVKDELDISANFDMNIASVTEFPGMKAETFKTLVEGGAKGIIFRATGAGDPNVAPIGANYDNLRSSFEYLQKAKIPIVVTTQAPDGIASMDVNDPGKWARELGAIPAWDMGIEAITVKLAWLLGRELPYQEIRKQMGLSVLGEIAPQRRI